MFSYNTNVHDGTQFTPHEIVFGTLTRLPSADNPPKFTTDETYNVYIEDLQKHLTEVQSLARQNLINAKTRFKSYCDPKLKPQNFAVGDLIHLLKELQKGKLDQEYTGCHRIVNTYPNENVRITQRV